MHLKHKKHRGITLIEIMLSLAISSVVMLGVLGLFASTIKNSSLTINAGRLDRYLHSAAMIMSMDIQRSGYWASADTSNNNPFMASSTDIFVNASNDCILMTYDFDGNGAVASISSSTDDERYGYRLQGDAIQYRPWGAPFDCNAAATAWDNLTDPNIVKITTFSVSKNEEPIDLDGTGPGTESIILRTVTVTITGELANDPSITKTITQNIKVYNDKYEP